MHAALVYPHQLFADHPALRGVKRCFVIEDPLFFSQYRFHVQKLVLHRATMRHFAEKLRRQGVSVDYVESVQVPTTEAIAPILARQKIKEVHFVEPNDDWLHQRLCASLSASRIRFRIHPDPHFLTPMPVIEHFAIHRKRWFFTDFYVQQRRRLKLLLDNDGRPIGGKWSYDPENRKKLPRSLPIPPVHSPPSCPFVREAQQYVQTQFPRSPGDLATFRYPVTADQAHEGLRDFLCHRFPQFGAYEDAIHASEPFLFHSVLTPSLNIGLISPGEVLAAASPYLGKIPLNAFEGFLRQIVGWREYMRGVYQILGRKQRTRNFWGHSHPMPSAFYDGSTGIEPVDTVIHRVLKYAYCHHIERLMILGNFMLLCEIDPDAIYQWFMELFIDSYDWVMVPNVYGMSQHADGGLITTKPYLSGSSYVLKMSNFRKGPWCSIWDGLYWRFIHKHRDFFAANPRMSVMAAQCDRMGSRLDEHLRTADRFLAHLHGGP